jgi:NADPH:quinone reductase-like Zn-dependent oxidoreductase
MDALIPDGERSVVIADVADVDPRPDEAVVAVEAFSINRGETFLLERPAPHWRPGKDVAGTVVSAAADGSGPPVGARVVGHPPSAGWAVRAAVPTSALAVLPDGVDMVTAAALPLAGLTALRLLRAAAPLIGRRLLITGASGGVGHYVVELAAAGGTEITAVTATPSRGARLASLGAAVVVHDVADARGPFDVVMESVGGDSLPVALARLAPNGLLIWFGQASRTPVTLNFFDFFAGPADGRIRHFDYTRGASGFAADLATLTRLVDEGRLHPEIGALRPWTETAHVLADLRARRIRGNAVLTTPARFGTPSR